MGYDKLIELKDKYKHDKKAKILFEFFNHINIIKYYSVDFSWEGESFNILKELFGDHVELIKFAWDLKQDYIYQYSYFWRSFRTPNNKLLLLESKIILFKIYFLWINLWFWYFRLCKICICYRLLFS